MVVVRAAGCASLTGANLSAMADTTDALAAMPSVAGTLLERMGIEILELSATRTTGTMPVEGNTQPYGLLHGGASAALAETLASYAAQVHAGAGRAAVGIELNATHHRSARSGVVTKCSITSGSALRAAKGSRSASRHRRRTSRSVSSFGPVAVSP